jgi:hypothetical protein
VGSVQMSCHNPAIGRVGAIVESHVVVDVARLSPLGHVACRTNAAPDDDIDRLRRAGSRGGVRSVAHDHEPGEEAAGADERQDDGGRCPGCDVDPAAAAPGERESLLQYDERHPSKSQHRKVQVPDGVRERARVAAAAEIWAVFLAGDRIQRHRQGHEADATDDEGPQSASRSSSGAAVRRRRPGRQRATP